MYVLKFILCSHRCTGTFGVAGVDICPRSVASRPKVHFSDNIQPWTLSADIPHPCPIQPPEGVYLLNSPYKGVPPPPGFSTGSKPSRKSVTSAKRSLIFFKYKRRKIKGKKQNENKTKKPKDDGRFLKNSLVQIYSKLNGKKAQIQRF